MQIFGYLISKFFAIKIVSELNAKPVEIHDILRGPCRTRFSLLRITPPTFNVFALFFNGLALGCMWGVIFSFIEGRKVTDILASLLG